MTINGTRDRIVNTESGSGGGGAVTQGTSPWTVSGTVGVSNFPSDYPDALAEATLASKLDPVTPFTVVKSASGDNLLLTPALGNRLQLRWLWAQAKATNTLTVVATFKSSVLGDIYMASLEPSQPFAHSAVIDLATDETLSVELDVAESVIINIDYREVV